MQIIERIKELTRILNEANYQYYVLDDPQMPPVLRSMRLHRAGVKEFSSRGRHSRF